MIRGSLAVVSNVLGRVTTGAFDGPRGPDVVHRIRVAKAWLSQGATIDIVLPRNVTCARCEGGGCDGCGRSGAISLRERDASEPPLTLALPPEGELGAEGEAPRLVLRVPERGGFGRADEPRGLLLLQVYSAPESDASVTLASPAGEGALDGSEQETEEASVPSHRARGMMVLALGIAGWISFYIMLRLAQLIK